MPFIALVVMLEWKPYDNKIKYEKIIENVNEKIKGIDDNDEYENEKKVIILQWIRFFFLLKMSNRKRMNDKTLKNQDMEKESLYPPLFLKWTITFFLSLSNH